MTSQPKNTQDEAQKKKPRGLKTEYFFDLQSSSASDMPGEIFDRNPDPGPHKNAPEPKQKCDE